MKRTVILLTFLIAGLAACATATAPLPRTPTPGSPFDLAGTQWELESLTLDGVTRTPAGAHVPTLDFGAEGTIGGSAGCNSFSGTYTAQGEMVSMVERVRTEMACSPNEIMTLEDAYLSAIGNARIFEKRGDQLSIIFGEGGGTLLFRAR